MGECKEEGLETITSHVSFLLTQIEKKRFGKKTEKDHYIIIYVGDNCAVCNLTEGNWWQK